MPELYTVTCPHCGASGQLSDPGLKGAAIYCPACSKQFLIPADPASPTPMVAAPAPVAAPVPAATAAPVPSATPIASVAPVAQPAMAAAAPIVTAGVPVAPVTPVMAVPVAQAMHATPALFDTPLIGEPPAQIVPSTTTVAHTLTGNRPTAPKSGGMGLLKVVLLSCFSAVMLFGLYMFSQKAPAKRPAVLASTKKKAKKPSRRKTSTVKPKETPVVSDDMPAEEEDSKIAVPDIEIAAVNPANSKPKPKLDKPAAPAAPTPPPKPAPSAPPQTIENIPPEVRTAVDEAIAKKDLPALIGFLGHAHAGVRLIVAQQLSSFEPAAAVAPALVQRLPEPNTEMRKAAIKALTRHGVEVPEVIPALGTVLQQDRDWQVKAAAANALAAIAIGNPERSVSAAGVLVPALERSYGEELPDLIMAAGSLGEAGKVAIPTLVKFLAHPQLAEDAVYSLAKLGNFESFPPILAGKGSLQIQQKKRMAEGLGQLRPLSPPALAIIQTLSADPDETVRVSAFTALQQAEPKLPEVIPLLEKAQADAAPAVQEAAKKTLVMYQATDPTFKMKTLLAEYQTEDKTVWASSEKAKAILDTKEDGFKSLVSILANPQAPSLSRELAARVLALSWAENWYDAKFTEDLQKVFNKPDESLIIRVGAAVALLKLKVVDPRLGATLLDAIRDKGVDFDIRDAALYSLPVDQPDCLSAFIGAAMECEAPEPEGISELGRRKRVEFHRTILSSMKSLKPEERSGVMPHLIAGLRHASGIVKWGACDTLQRYEEAPPEAIEVLRAALKDEQKEVREEVLETIGKLHKVAAAAIPDLREGLKSDDRHWRMLSAMALEQFGPAAADAIPDLLAILSDPSKLTDNVARAAARIAPDSDMVAMALNQALSVPELREEVVKALQEVGPKAAVAVPELQKILMGTEEKLRIPALRVLGNVGEAAKPAVPDIVRLLTDKEEATREAAANSLGSLKEHAIDTVPDLVKALTDASQNVQRESLRALGEIGPAAKAAIPDVEKYLTTAATDQLKQLAESVLAKLKADPTASDSAKS